MKKLRVVFVMALLLAAALSDQRTAAFACDGEPDFLVLNPDND